MACSIKIFLMILFVISSKQELIFFNFLLCFWFNVIDIDSFLNVLVLWANFKIAPLPIPHLLVFMPFFNNYYYLLGV